MRRLALAALLLAIGCHRPDDGRWLATGDGQRAEVSFRDVGADFAKARAPGHLTFVMLTGSHCAGCRKAEKVFDRLREKRPDIAVRTLPFPEELCVGTETRAACQAAVKALEAAGGCFTPTIFAFAPDGSLLARDDTCRDERPGRELLRTLAIRELGDAKPL